MGCAFLKIIKMNIFLPPHLLISIINFSTEKVTWEIRWEDKENAEVHGPFPNEKMLQWQDSGYFDKVAYVRRVSDRAGTWYSTKRIDFELYS